MATLTTLESGLKVVPGPHAGDGGQALTDNFDLLNDTLMGSGNVPLIGVEVNAGTLVTLQDIDQGKIYTNTSATALAEFNLPVPASGLMFTFVVNHASGISLNTSGGATLQMGPVESKSAGSIVASNQVGSVLNIVALDTTKWVTLSEMGVWEVETS